MHPSEVDGESFVGDLYRGAWMVISRILEPLQGSLLLSVGFLPGEELFSQEFLFFP